MLRMIASRAALVSSVAVGVIGAAVAVAFVLVEARSILLTAFGAIVIAEAVRPLVDRLSTRVPRVAAVAIVFVGLLAAIAAAWWIALRELAPQFAAFGQAFPGYASAATQLLEHARSEVSARVPGGVQLPASAPAGPILQALLGAGITVITFASTIALALLLAIFWIGVSDSFRKFLVSLFDEKAQGEADSLIHDLGTQVGGYAIGTIVNGAIVAAASILALLILRAPYPIVLGLLQGLLIALPYVGTLIGVLAAGAAVFTVQGWVNAAAAVAALSVIASLEGSFIAPRVYQRALDIDPFSTTLAIALGGTLFGTGGIILAVPAAAVLKTLVVRVFAPAIRRTRDLNRG